MSGEVLSTSHKMHGTAFPVRRTQEMSVFNSENQGFGAGLFWGGSGSGNFLFGAGSGSW